MANFPIQGIQHTSKFLRLAKTAQRLNPAAEQFVLNRPMAPVFKRLLGPELVPSQLAISSQQKLNLALSNVLSHPYVRPIYTLFQPEIETAKSFLFRHWPRLTKPVRLVGEACGFVTTRQMGYTVKPVKDLYRNQIADLREGIRFDVYTGIFGALLGCVKAGTSLAGYDLPAIIAIPTISAGMSMLAKGVVDVIRKTSQLGRAQKSLKVLMAFNKT